KKKKKKKKKTLARDLLLKMLALNPAERITAVQALNHEWLKDLHREEEEITCPQFDLTFEFEKSITTKFGVRRYVIFFFKYIYMMYDTLLGYQQQKMVEHEQQQITFVLFFFVLDTRKSKVKKDLVQPHVELIDQKNNKQDQEDEQDIEEKKL
ncbi:hypothetical protein RFI_07684, partial [Reticulomyxa filosa]